MKEKLIFILLDGCRYDTSIEQMGLVNHYVEKKLAKLVRVKGEVPSNSRPIYEVLMTGTETKDNKIFTNENRQKSIKKSIFQKVKEKGGTTAAAAYYWFSELYNRTPFNFYEDRFQFNTKELIGNGIFYYEDFYPDSHLFSDAHYLIEKKSPNFILVHSMNIDYIGHKFSAPSKEYSQVVNKIDYIIGQYLDNWLELGYEIIITSDHGMDENGLHGGTMDSHRILPMYIFSKENFLEDEIEQVKIENIVSKILGV